MLRVLGSLLDLTDCLILWLIPILVTGLALTSTETNVTTNANPTSLIGNDSTQDGAFCQSGELLRAVDFEGSRTDCTARVYLCGDVFLLVRSHVLILGLFQFFEECEVELVVSFGADRKIREDEVAGRNWTVKIGYTRDGGSGQDWGSGSIMRSTSVGNGASLLEGGAKEEACVVGQGDVTLLFALEYVKLDNGWWIDGTTVRGGCGSVLKVICDTKRRCKSKRHATYILRPDHKPWLCQVAGGR